MFTGRNWTSQIVLQQNIRDVVPVLAQVSTVCCMDFGQEVSGIVATLSETVVATPSRSAVS